jgi:hypothetical protein
MRGEKPANPDGPTDRAHPITIGSGFELRGDFNHGDAGLGHLINRFYRPGRANPSGRQGKNDSDAWLQKEPHTDHF